MILSRWVFIFVMGLGFSSVCPVSHYSESQKNPVVEDQPTKSEPRPVYPPLKRKPYTRSVRLV